MSENRQPETIKEIQERMSYLKLQIDGITESMKRPLPWHERQFMDADRKDMRKELEKLDSKLVSARTETGEGVEGE